MKKSLLLICLCVLSLSASAQNTALKVQEIKYGTADDTDVREPDRGSGDRVFRACPEAAAEGPPFFAGMGLLLLASARDVGRPSRTAPQRSRYVWGHGEAQGEVHVPGMVLKST